MINLQGIKILPIKEKPSTLIISSSIYVDKLIALHLGFEEVIKQYGNLTNLIRLEVEQYRSDLGHSNLISIDLPLSVYHANFSLLSVLQVATLIIEQDEHDFASLNPCTMQQIKENKRIMADLYALMHLPDINFIYFSEGSNHMLTTPIKPVNAPANWVDKLDKILEEYEEWQSSQDQETKQLFGVETSNGFFDNIAKQEVQFYQNK